MTTETIADQATPVIDTRTDLQRKRVLPVGTVVRGRKGRYKHPWRRFNQQNTVNKIGVIIGYKSVQPSKNVPDGLIHLVKMFYNKKTYRTIRDEIIPLTDQEKYGSHIRRDKEMVECLEQSLTSKGTR